MMVIKLKLGMLLVVLLALPGVSLAQNFSYLHDYDSTNDWGYHIFLNNDKSFFVVGGGFRNGFGVTGFRISPDGSTILNKNNQIKYTGTNTYSGLSGRVKMIDDNRYLMPLSVNQPHPVPDYLYQNGGLAILDSFGNTNLVRLYTDTAIYRENFSDCEIASGGGFLLAGYRGGTKNKDPIFSGLLIKTDNNGNKLWDKIYQKEPGKTTELVSIQELGDRSLLIGAQSRTLVWVNRGNYDFYYRNSPWFIIVDPQNGNIIKDTFYSNGFQYGGNIFQDINGGYFSWGRLDTLVMEPSRFYENFFPYFAHLDDNFRIDRIKVWQPVQNDWHRYIWMARNTADSGYILMGSARALMPGIPLLGWAARLDKHGNVLWDNTYTMDSTYEGYLVDGIEMLDGGFVFTGNHRDGDSASWRGYDMWLLRVDSNGCLVPGCTPTTIQESILLEPDNIISIYPNPTTGRLTIAAKANGTLRVYSLDGREVARYSLTENNTDINLPQGLTPGIYIGKFMSEDNRITNLLIAYQL